MSYCYFYFYSIPYKNIQSTVDRVLNNNMKKHCILKGTYGTYNTRKYCVNDGRKAR